MILANEEMRVINEQIENAYNYFNSLPSEEHDLIDSAIYTINALEAQRRHVINKEKNKYNKYKIVPLNISDAILRSLNTI